MFVKVPLFYIRLKNNLVSKRVRIVLAGGNGQRLYTLYRMFVEYTTTPLII